ncbi:fumarylacetoacetate hydrolase family protein [Paenibacillus koleovorans]|uniref:fumarylacetoacetate hydrolase family protein n=1 Tax=Paenibacillus koleovorans TaxID=121608 RepID=UPI000FDB8114|nr:fumarylacetoacetate hydrolase family protein [Paenibacillus koleovorans]
MKLVTILAESGQHQLGVKTEEGILNIQAAIEVVAGASSVPQSTHAVIEGGASAIQQLQAYVDQALAASAADKATFIQQESEIAYGPSVPNPRKIICVGLNYRRHAEETNAKIPTTPILFSKFDNTLTGHNHDVPLPKTSSKVDYEVELCIVIGKNAKYVSKEEALDHVFGYTVVNDISARDLQLRTQQWLLGKTCDGFSPLGPYLVSADEVGDPNNLNLKLTVNGEVRQNSNTSDMIFYCDEIVSYISQHMTLYPGDIILTGTPEGVILGYPEEKQVWLKHGDVMTVEIEKLGSLTNRMVDEA